MEAEPNGKKFINVAIFHKNFLKIILEYILSSSQ